MAVQTSKIVVLFNEDVYLYVKKGEIMPDKKESKSEGNPNFCHTISKRCCYCKTQRSRSDHLKSITVIVRLLWVGWQWKYRPAILFFFIYCTLYVHQMQYKQSTSLVQWNVVGCTALWEADHNNVTTEKVLWVVILLWLITSVWKVYPHATITHVRQYEGTHIRWWTALS